MYILENGQIEMFIDSDLTGNKKPISVKKLEVIFFSEIFHSF